MATMSEPEPDRTHPAYRLNTQMPIAASAVSDRSDEQAVGTPEVPPTLVEGSDLDRLLPPVIQEQIDRLLERLNETPPWLLRLREREHDPAETVTLQIVQDPDTGGMKGQKLARFSQIPPDVLLELAEHFGKGELKYPNDADGKANWQRGYSWRLSVDALGRHLLAFLAGEDIDPDSGSSHLIAVMWHCATLRWFQLNGKGTDYRD